MRVAYHIQSHKDPEQIVRLVDRIQRSGGESIVLVSHQRGGEPLDQARLTRRGEACVLPCAGGYGDFSHVDRYMESARWLLDRDDPFDWFVNLSGQDYPLAPVSKMEQELATSGHDAWLGFFDIFGPESKWPHPLGHTRYDFRHWRTNRLSHTWQRRLRALGAVNLVQPWVRFSPSFGAIGVRRRSMFSDQFHCYGGSFFGAVSRSCIEYLVEFDATHPEVADYFRPTLAPDEVFVHTVLGNAGRFDIQPRARRYFDFSLNQGNHPKTLGMADLPRMLASQAWFARKFDAHSDSEVLDELDRHNGWDREPSVAS